MNLPGAGSRGLVQKPKAQARRTSHGEEIVGVALGTTIESTEAFLQTAQSIAHLQSAGYTTLCVRKRFRERTIFLLFQKFGFREHRGVWPSRRPRKKKKKKKKKIDDRGRFAVRRTAAQRQTLRAVINEAKRRGVAGRCGIRLHTPWR